MVNKIADVESPYTKRATLKGKPSGVERVCLGILALLILVYVVAYSSKSIANYATGYTMFDLATFEQGFWNATQGTLFSYSLEGEMSRFGRHFSPIFIPMLPIYALHRDPSTLLVLQSLALGLGAIPLYLFARRRMNSPPAALLLSSLYLANPAVHDVNIVNEFHEIAFAVPLLLLAFYGIETRRWGLYVAAAIGALMTKEEVALTVAALGVYVFLFTRQRRLGLLTVVGSLLWFISLTQVVMPALRGPYGPVPFAGYDYLGNGVPGIATGVLTKSGELLSVVTAPLKQQYVYWLLLPVAFLALLAPEVLLVAAPALLEILASTFPPTYEIFERYVAPILPFVFLAAAVGAGRVRDNLAVARFPSLVQTAAPIVLVLGMGGATVYAQASLHKYPTQLLYPMEPDSHVETAIRFTRVIPEAASVLVEDHRWLARLAHRQHLYSLSEFSPDAEYFLLDRKVAPITNASKESRDAGIRRIAESPDYLGLRCEDGLTLYVRREANRRDGGLFTPYRWEHDREDDFSGLIRLVGYSIDRTVVRPGDSLTVTLHWQARREPIGADYNVFVNALDKQWRSAGQHDGPPQSGTCGTAYWKQGQIVEDSHSLTIKPDATPGNYDLRIGLYTLADMKRLPIVGRDGAVIDDSVAVPVEVRR